MSMQERWTAEQYRDFISGKGKMKSKAKRSRSFLPELSGRSFGSRLEAAIAEMLCMQVRTGTIARLKFQTTVTLEPSKIRWKADFAYIETSTGIEWVHEAKGFQDRRWKLVHDQLRLHRPLNVRISYGVVKNGRLRIAKTEEIRKAVR